ncbi:hypothetical protein [Agromyces larvae]|uniref:Helix-turn-helix domain-containing protein n=1 Tax=Agromyces larvae TaxID=2929802 RepID=A0ABY4C3X5_9MICO|nr:hypothetical protein [Agromyces larvae]UOE45909.1 hypothetical protein MTO99_09260 [Agromyces larvae]
MIEVVKEAARAYAHRDELNAEEKTDAARSLGKRGVWSIRQIAGIVGLPAWTVAREVQAKADRTGGKFSPESLQHLVAALSTPHREAMWAAVLRAEAAGTGVAMLARLTGLPLATVKWRVKRGPVA